MELALTDLDTVKSPAARRRNRHPEDHLHVSIWKALRYCLAPEVVVWSTENRFNGMMEGSRRKARGVIAGCPDLAVHWHGRVAYIELKAEKGRLSEAQRDLHGRLRRAGIETGVCRSLVEVLQFLRGQGCPVTARL